MSSAPEIREVTFAPAGLPVAWGFATYSWGREAYAITAPAP